MLNFASFLYSLNNDLLLFFVCFFPDPWLGVLCGTTRGLHSENHHHPSCFAECQSLWPSCLLFGGGAVHLGFSWGLDWTSVCCVPQLAVVQVFGYRQTHRWLLFRCVVTDKHTGGYCSGVWLQTNPQVVIVQVCGYRQAHRWLLFRCVVTDKPTGGYCSGVWLQTNPQVVNVWVFGNGLTDRLLLFKCLVTD